MLKFSIKNGFVAIVLSFLVVLDISMILGPVSITSLAFHLGAPLGVGWICVILLFSAIYFLIRRWFLATKKN